MIMDYNAEFSSKQRIGTAAHTGVLSTKSVDMGRKVNLFVGKNRPNIVIHGVSFAASSTDHWLKIELIAADDAALTSNLITISEFTVDDIQDPNWAGKIFQMPVKPHAPKRYFGLRYTQGNTANDCVATAAVVFQPQENAIEKMYE